jgi:hypothetical protein
LEQLASYVQSFTKIFVIAVSVATAAASFATSADAAFLEWSKFEVKTWPE